MKILHLNTLYGEGGAAKGAERLSRGLQDAGHQSDIGCFWGDTGFCRPAVSRSVARHLNSLDRLPLKMLYPHRMQAPFSLNWLPHRRGLQVVAQEYDLVNLHWVNQAFVAVSDLAQIRKPLVWTLHDSWAFTGGCHIPGECRRYETACGGCPKLRSRFAYDLSRVMLQWKVTQYRRIRNLTVVTPSRWLAGCAARSALFRHIPIEVIPNALDTEIFRPQDRILCKQRLGINPSRPVILFGASGAFSDPNKGYRYLREAIIRERQQFGDAVLLVFGGDLPDGDLPMDVVSAGIVKDEQALAAVYAAADVMVVPSESENLPFTAMEAIACGVPVVAFRIGGLEDIVDNGITGILVDPFDTGRLGNAIREIITLCSDEQRKIAQAARMVALQRFALHVQANRYAALYSSLLGSDSLDSLWM